MLDCLGSGEHQCKAPDRRPCTERRQGGGGGNTVLAFWRGLSLEPEAMGNADS